MVKLIKALCQDEVQSNGHDRAKKELRQKSLKGLGVNWKIEVIFARDCGGHVNIWEEGESSLTHVWKPSDDNKWHKFTQANFWDWENALAEYKAVTNMDSLLDLGRRNS